ncbi:MAG: chemotaxis protein CheW [Betaproteobacteria bacterium]
MKQGPESSQGNHEAKLSLLCRVRTHLCAVPLEYVAETMRPMPVTPLAGSLSFVRGMSVIRGTAIPVVDVGSLLGSETPASPTRFVTLKIDRNHVALAVEEVVGIRSLAAVALNDLPPLLRSANADLVSAVGMLDRELLLVLQTARIVPDSVWRSMQSAQTA